MALSLLGSARVGLNVTGAAFVKVLTCSNLTIPLDIFLTNMKTLLVFGRGDAFDVSRRQRRGQFVLNNDLHHMRTPSQLPCVGIHPTTRPMLVSPSRLSLPYRMKRTVTFTFRGIPLLLIDFITLVRDTPPRHCRCILFSCLIGREKVVTLENDLVALRQAAEEREADPEGPAVSQVDTQYNSAFRCPPKDSFFLGPLTETVITG